MGNNAIPSTYAKEPGILSQYLDFLTDAEELLPATAYNYYMTLRSLAKFLKHRRKRMDCQPDEVIMSGVSVEEMTQITEDEWGDYLDYCQFRLQEKNSSLAVRISVIRGFYEWLSETANTPPVTHVLQTERPSQKKEARTPLSEKEEEALYKSLDGEHKERNICILRFFLHCGLGLEELCALDLEDIDLTTITVRKKNGEVSREIPLDEKTITTINEYLPLRNPPTDGTNAFFVSLRKGRMRRGAVQKLLRKAVATCNSVEGITVRDLQFTAKERIVKEQGLDKASDIINIKTQAYFRSSFGRFSKDGNSTVADVQA